jgi:hypothetical protein
MAMLQSEIRKAARAMARRSVEARKQAWGEDEFRNRLREWGRMGGRPKSGTKSQTKKGGK